MSLIFIAKAFQEAGFVHQQARQFRAAAQLQGRWRGVLARRLKLQMLAQAELARRERQVTIAKVVRIQVRRKIERHAAHHHEKRMDSLDLVVFLRPRSGGG